VVESYDPVQLQFIERIRKNRTGSFRSNSLVPISFVEFVAKVEAVASSILGRIENSPKFGWLYPPDLGPIFPEFNEPLMQVPVMRSRFNLGFGPFHCGISREGAPMYVSHHVQIGVQCDQELFVARLQHPQPQGARF
jgi:hypothetical protein